ncbi:unnamed protein product [Durusdinium trenchii]
MRLLQSAKAFVDDIISASAEKGMLEESALKLLKKVELLRRRCKNAQSRLFNPKSTLRSLQSMEVLESPKRASVSAARSSRKGSKEGSDKQVEWLKMRRARPAGEPEDGESPPQGHCAGA